MRLLLVCLIAAALAGPALADNGPPPPSPQQQAAIDACKAKGFARGSDAFNQCIAATLGGPSGGQPGPPPGGQPGPPPQGGAPSGGKPGPPPQNGTPPPPTAAFNACQAQGLKVGTDAFNACVKAFDANAGKKPQPTTPAQQAAMAACKAHGLVENTSAFQECMKGTTSGGAPNATAQAALDGCIASGVPQRTDAFKKCVSDATAAAAVAGWTGEQLAALNACKAAGNAYPSAALAACLSKMLTKLIPDKPGAKKELATIAADCQKQKLIGAAFTQCVKDGLGS